MGLMKREFIDRTSNGFESDLPGVGDTNNNI